MVFNRLNKEVKVNDSNPETLFGDIFVYHSLTLPVLIVLSGDSESGKSHFSTRLEEQGLSLRFKIYRDIAEYLKIHSRQLYELGPFEASSLIMENPGVLLSAYSYALKTYKEQLSASGLSVATVETIKHPWIFEKLREELEFSVLSIFITAPFEKRVENEARKLGKTKDEIASLVVEKDKQKRSYGLEEVQKRSDIILVNEGALVEYNSWIDSLAKYFLHLAEQK